MENNRHGLTRQGSNMGKSSRDGDFQEEAVWDVLDEHEDCHNIKSNESTEASVLLQRSHPTAGKMIPRSTTSFTSSFSISPNEGQGAMTMKQNSAPLNIPDWSKIRSRRSKTAGNDDDGAIDEHDDDGADNNVSPQEFFLARSRSSSFSVTEGSGRTLRGRDLRKVRYAVLKQTGFLE